MKNSLVIKIQFSPISLIIFEPSHESNIQLLLLWFLLHFSSEVVFCISWEDSKPVLLRTCLFFLVCSYLNWDSLKCLDSTFHWCVSRISVRVILPNRHWDLLLWIYEKWHWQYIRVWCCRCQSYEFHSTVTDLAKFRGWSTSVPLTIATWYESSCNGMVKTIGLRTSGEAGTWMTLQFLSPW